MTLSPERERFILDMANDEWVDPNLDLDSEQFEIMCKKWAKNTEEFLNNKNTPSIELHLFADRYNWDKGAANMLKVASHANCAAATALMLYWRAEPEFFLKFTQASEIPYYAVDGYEIVQYIEARYLAGKYKVSSLSYDPVAEGMVGRQNDKVSTFVRTIPDAMLHATSL